MTSTASDQYLIRPGPYVMLAVSDTGWGMDPETQSRNLRAVLHHQGKRQRHGLGLSTVYGIVKQSGGCVSVNSVFKWTWTTFPARLLAAGREGRARRLGGRLESKKRNVKRLRNGVAGGRRRISASTWFAKPWQARKAIT